jgi:GLPGLI family protein
MKKLVLCLGILISLTAAGVVSTQISEGVIIYEVKINMHRNLPADRQEMKNMIPEFRTLKEQLAFNANESLHKPFEDEEPEEDIQGQGGMVMRFHNPRSEFYINHQLEKVVRLQDFMGKNYIIEDSLKVTPWKLGNETKEIRGYVCKSASFFNEERKQKVVAWYTDQLRPFLGPESFNSLPGGILQVNINDGERVITAVSIEPRALKKGELKMSSGEKTTQAEFQKIQDDQVKRMRANGANVIIRN